MTALSLALAAIALLLWPESAPPRHLARPQGPPRTPRPEVWHPAAAIVVGVSATILTGIPAGLAACAGSWWLLRRSRHPKNPDDVLERLRSASVLDMLAACLRAGMPVPTALEAVAPGAPPGTETALHATANLLALGADPAPAWTPSEPARASPS